MAVSYDDLLSRHKVSNTDMDVIIPNPQIIRLSLTLVQWEFIGRSLGLEDVDIESIKRERDTEEEKRDKMLRKWKERRGSAATYEELARALLQINRTDLAERVVTIRLSLITPPLPANSGRMEMASTLSDMPTAHITSVHSITYNTDIKQRLRKLEEEFCQLVVAVEVALEKQDIELMTITRRFSMLPRSVKRWHEIDKNYEETKRKILECTTIKELFDNLTRLKYWSYMLPETLEHILEDANISNIHVHQWLHEYTKKLTAFKRNTKLGDIIGFECAVPEYCAILIMKVEGWEDKTIEEAENEVVNIMHCTACGLRLKGMEIGCIKLTFILLEPIKISPDSPLHVMCRKHTVISIELDGELVYTEDNTELKDEVTGNIELAPERLWYSTGRIRYQVHGGRDVLIISGDLPPHQPEAVARRPGQLTEEDKQKLLRQGVTGDYQDEVDIIRARWELDKKHKIVKVKSGHSLSREEVSKSITHLFNTIKDGAVLYYIGAGRRNTGDWCFQGGFITFKDITQLYLQSKLRGRVLTIVSDCSYSGHWVRDCMEFLDEQGVQPCGHKAREKGMLIKVFTSCKSSQIPTEYRYTVCGTENDNNTGLMTFWPSKQLLETQKTNSIDSSHIGCSHKTITEPCTLKPGYTWKKDEEGRRVFLVRGENQGRPVWHYILLVDDEDTIDEFYKKFGPGTINLRNYGQVLHSGWGEDSPNDLKERIKEEYLC